MSLNEIPTTNNRDYFVKLTMETEDVIRRMLWKAYFFLLDQGHSYKYENCGFKSLKTVPLIEALSVFGNDLLGIINRLTFHKCKNLFQKILITLLKIINPVVYISKSDKTAKLYKLSPKDYGTLVKSYMKTDTTTSKLINKINCNRKFITDELEISYRVSKLQAKEACILLKDHKPHFRTKPSTSLINPTRPEVGRISKTVLERTKQSIKHSLGLLQWINSVDVINWFNGIQNKDQCTFV